MYTVWGMSGGVVVCEPQTDPGMGSPGPDVDGPGGDGGGAPAPAPGRGRGRGAQNASRPRRACLLSATAGTQSKKLVLLLAPSQLQLFNPNIHAGFKALLEPLRGQEPSTLQTKTRTPQA